MKGGRGSYDCEIICNLHSERPGMHFWGGVLAGVQLLLSVCAVAIDRLHRHWQYPVGGTSVRVDL